LLEFRRFISGHYQHIGAAEKRYNFVDPETLLRDFWNDVEAWRR